jgi:hypothetical protein
MYSNSREGTCLFGVRLYRIKSSNGNGEYAEIGKARCEEHNSIVDSRDYLLR